MPSSPKLRLKGKFVSRKAHQHYLTKVENGRKRKKHPDAEIQETSSSKSAKDHSSSDEETKPDYFKGRRIVEIDVLAKHLWCTSCNEVLSLRDVESETLRGLASVFSVRCHKCLMITLVPTGKQHAGATERATLFDINSKAAMGVLHSGMGVTHFNKILSCMNMPTIEFKTFKRHEREVGPLIEAVAKDSCVEAAEKERSLTIMNKDNIENILPDHLKSGFIIPSEVVTSTPQPQTDETPAPTATPPHTPKSTPNRSSATSTLSRIRSPGAVHKRYRNVNKERAVTFNDIVRIMVSYDMGWSRRASGRNYDSLNGYGAAIGSFSGLVLDYSQCNRKCKKCDLGQDPATHDCRLNYTGSAKGMEPHVAKSLVTNSSILKDKNLEVGVLIGDDDSSTIAACRGASEHTIVKQSDRNHAGKGVKSTLYKIENKHKEMTSEAVPYFHRCFTYAMTQNKGNSREMAKAIRCIPHHAFNDHQYCGDWCGYLKDPENYEHRVIVGGFTDPNLKRDLIEVFGKLADNAEKFSAGASSNANESLNNMMATKCPKARCYSLSESADYRFAAVVGQKNIGEGYTQEALALKELSPGSPFHSKFVSSTDFKSARRLKLTSRPEFKKKRIQNRKLRNALARRKENIEGVTYESNVALLTEPGVNFLDDNVDEPTDVDEAADINDSAVVFFDLETGGFSADADILQIAAKCGAMTFNTFAKPSKPFIPKASSDVHGITFMSGDILQHGILVHSFTIRVALLQFLEFLCKINKKIYLAAHNLPFDGPRLLRAIQSHSLLDQFSAVITGMLDTLAIIKGNTGRRGKGECTLKGLADWLQISSKDAHDASVDVKMLHEILKKIPITHQQLIDSATNWNELVTKYNENDLINERLKSLAPLTKVVGRDLRIKMAAANISIELLLSEYKKSQNDAIVKLLSKEKNKKPLVTKHKKTIEKILQWITSEVQKVPETGN